MVLIDALVRYMQSVSPEVCVYVCVCAVLIHALPAFRLAQDKGLEAATLKKGEVLSSLKDAPSLPPSSSLLAAPPLSSILDKRLTTGKGFEGQFKKLTVADGMNHEGFHRCVHKSGRL